MEAKLQYAARTRITDTIAAFSCPFATHRDRKISSSLASPPPPPSSFPPPLGISRSAGKSYKRATREWFEDGDTSLLLLFLKQTRRILSAGDRTLCMSSISFSLVFCSSGGLHRNGNDDAVYIALLHMHAN